jgi:hypothetical protein
MLWTWEMESVGNERRELRDSAPIAMEPAMEWGETLVASLGSLLD